MQEQEHTYGQNCICLLWYFFGFSPAFSLRSTSDSALPVPRSGGTQAEQRLQCLKSHSEHKACLISAVLHTDPCVRGEITSNEREPDYKSGKMAREMQQISAVALLRCLGCVWQARVTATKSPFLQPTLVFKENFFFQRICLRELALLPHVDFQWKPRN